MAPHGVVVLDQWPIVRMGIGRALPSLSYRILEEADGVVAARKALERRRPDLVILGNHQSASLVGLVELAKGAGARVLVLVDGADRGQLSALAKAGADGIISGSSTAEQLAAAADRLMAGERALSPSLVPALAGMARPGPGAGRGDGQPMLTPREQQVLECLVRGARNEEIASELFLSPATVKSHLSRIYTKLEVRSRHEATVRAVKLGLAQP